MAIAEDLRQAEHSVEIALHDLDVQSGRHPLVDELDRHLQLRAVLRQYSQLITRLETCGVVSADLAQRYNAIIEDSYAKYHDESDVRKLKGMAGIAKAHIKELKIALVEVKAFKIAANHATKMINEKYVEYAKKLKRDEAQERDRIEHELHVKDAELLEKFHTTEDDAGRMYKAVVKKHELELRKLRDRLGVLEGRRRGVFTNTHEAHSNEFDIVEVEKGIRASETEIRVAEEKRDDLIREAKQKYHSAAAALHESAQQAADTEKMRYHNTLEPFHEEVIDFMGHFSRIFHETCRLVEDMEREMIHTNNLIRALEDIIRLGVVPWESVHTRLEKAG